MNLNSSHSGEFCTNPVARAIDRAPLIEPFQHSGGGRVHAGLPVHPESSCINWTRHDYLRIQLNRYLPDNKLWVLLRLGDEVVYRLLKAGCHFRT